MKKLTSLAFAFLSFLTVHSQDDTFLTRLRGISRDDRDVFFVDGTTFLVRTVDEKFNKYNIQNGFLDFKVKAKELIVSDSGVTVRNYHVIKSKEIIPNLTEYNSFYFVEKESEKLVAVVFSSMEREDKNLQRKIVNLIVSNSIPKNVYAGRNMDSVDFVGRRLQLGPACGWVSVNNIKCSAQGQMDWGIHATLESAKRSIDYQLKITKSEKGRKIIEETEVSVIFEGNPVLAKRMVYDFKGVPSLLLSTTGAKTLTVYYVAAPVRGNYVSCTLSFWNNDRIEPDGLPLLPAQVMSLMRE